MKDAKYVIIFTALGIILAWFVSAPLRRPSQEMPRVGTPLDAMGGSTVATSREQAPAQVQTYASGRIDLGPSLPPSSIAGYSLFIMAKPSMDGRPAGGPPLAVMREPRPLFPYRFSLTTENNMMGSDFYNGDIVIVARLDKDGVAGPKQPDDFEAIVPIKTGQSREISVVLNR